MKNRLIKLGKKNGEREMERRETNPFFSLQQEVNRLFDDFFHGFDLTSSQWNHSFFGSNLPKLNVKEKENEIEVEAELPGFDEKEIEVTFSENVLTIKGEKNVESDKKEKGNYHMERSSFHRSIPIYSDVDSNKVKASLKKGILTVTLPKTTEAKKNVKKIAVEGG